MDRLGLPIAELARRTGVDREAITRARDGHAQARTYGKLEKALDQLEREIGPVDANEAIATIDLPDGTKVTFSGVGPEQAAEFVTTYLQTRNVDPPG